MGVRALRVRDFTIGSKRLREHRAFAFPRQGRHCRGACGYSDFEDWRSSVAGGKSNARGLQRRLQPGSRRARPGVSVRGLVDGVRRRAGVQAHLAGPQPSEACGAIAAGGIERRNPAGLAGRIHQRLLACAARGELAALAHSFGQCKPRRLRYGFPVYRASDGGSNLGGHRGAAAVAAERLVRSVFANGLGDLLALGGLQGPPAPEPPPRALAGDLRRQCGAAMRIGHSEV
mmetsp:Transcript_19649/g.55025  ORF Transcript_19649/g.55025 Transcript_19649/m.55025 type:complete len:231 (+) Transcript_19649:795-1487(+)